MGSARIKKRNISQQNSMSNPRNTHVIKLFRMIRIALSKITEKSKFFLTKQNSGKSLFQFFFIFHAQLKHGDFRNNLSYSECNFLH